MNSIDWNVWLADVGRKFPAIREWVRGIIPEEDYHALLDAWETAMSDLPLEDCLTANARMLSGELDGPGEWPPQWQGLPARIRRHVQTLRDERAGHLPISDGERIEHERIRICRDGRKYGIPPETIDGVLRAKGYEGIVVPSRDLVKATN